MYKILCRQTLFFGWALALFLLYGCAGGKASQSPEVLRPPQIETAEIEKSADYKLALKSYKAANFVQAAALFKKVYKSKNLEDSDLYYYANALDQSKQYAEAISIYSQYLEKLGRRGIYFLPALDARNMAKEKAEQSRQATAKASKAAKVLKQIGPSLEANWLVVKVKTDNRVASFTEPLTGIEMLLVKGDCYQMGDLYNIGKEDEKPVHQVCIDDFYLGKYEVTQAQWQRLMGYNPSATGGEQHPVDSVSWQEAVAFAERLSGKTGRYRLPTEAEWEYAARSGGKKQLYSGSDDVDAVAWHEENSADSSQPVGQKLANGFGFHDMSGNVYEWCLDRYAADYYTGSPQQNPAGANAGKQRTRRGGSWESEIAYSRSSYRTNGNETGYQLSDTGFRLTLPLTDKSNR